MKKLIPIILITVVVIGAIAYTDLIIRPGYLLKTMVKLPLFLLIPIVYSLFQKSFQPVKLLKPSTKGLKTGFLLGIMIYVIVVGTYFIAHSFVDLSPMKTSLEQNLGINKENFIVIGLYVCIVNSFLEEWFFRGFLFLQLRQQSRGTAYLISSLGFAVYHLAIMDGMFPVGLIILILIGLFVGGTIFNYLNERNNNIYASWFCHSFANFAMNTVGFYVFYSI